MPKDIEIEIQVKVEKVAPLLVFLRSKAKLVGENRQIDQYFTPSHRNFIKTRPVKEWLRVRDSNGKTSINYKNYHYNKTGKSYFCDEFESGIENSSALGKIFKALDIKPTTIVDKKRQIWTYSDYEISIDRVKNLGNFVEVEYKGKKSKLSPKQIGDQMVEFLKQHGCGKISRNFLGYPFLLLFPKEAKYELQ